MAGARWARKCSVFDGDEECDTVQSAGLTLPRWKSSHSREYQGSVQASAASCAGPIVTRAGAVPWANRDNGGRSSPDLRFRSGISGYREVKLLLRAVARLR
jgi:hypothetical protein